MGKAFKYQYDAGAAMETDFDGSLLLRLVKNLR